jgi:hypothetical protein
MIDIDYKIIVKRTNKCLNEEIDSYIRFKKNVTDNFTSFL